VKAHTRKEEIMDYIQSVASWIAMKSIMARTIQRAGEANPSQPEEEFVPFNLPPAKTQPTEEAQPAAAVAA
jgi:hypothetical protein